MRFEIVAALLNLVAVQATAIPAAFPEPEPQAGGSVAIGVPRSIPPKYRSTAKRAIIRYPAFTLQAKGKGKGFSMDPNGQAGILRIGQGMCSSCTLLSAHYRLVHPNGQEATPKEGIYIHHMTSFLSPKNSSSPIGGLNIGGGGVGGAYFIDRGEDSGQTDTVFTSQDGKFNSGYHITGKPSITVSYDFVNYEDSPKQLHLELEYEYVNGIVGQDAGHTLKSVSGAVRLNGATTSGSMPVTKPTTIMWARGHLHAGGDSMSLLVNNQVKCVSRPTYDDAGVITVMSLCPGAISLKAGDTLKIQSVYDTQKHKLRQATDGSGHAAHGRLGGSDVMGMFAMSYTM
jgi:hypothetical protein